MFPQEPEKKKVIRRFFEGDKVPASATFLGIGRTKVVSNRITSEVNALYFLVKE